MRNPIGINLWNWMVRLSDGADALIPRIKELGFSAVEIPMDTLEHDWDALGRAIRAAGLRVSLCVSMGKGLDLSSFDPEVRARTAEYLRACCRCAQALHAEVLCGPLYSGGGKAHLLPPEQREAEWALAVDGLRSLAQYAEERCLRLAVEPINRYRTSVVNNVSQALQMVREICCENVGILFDTYQANIEEADPVEALREVLRAGRLFHFHACENHRGVPGSGHIPWQPLLSALREFAYEGHITMETFLPGGLDAGWLPPAETPDQRAAAGLGYLKARLEGSII